MITVSLIGGRIRVMGDSVQEVVRALLAEYHIEVEAKKIRHDSYTGRAFFDLRK